MNQDLVDQINEFLKYDKNPETIKEITQAIGNLSRMFTPRIEFGTAGLRGFMGAGYANMNDLIIIQATQGICKVLQKNPKKLENGVMLGFDGRYNSEKWAKLTASVFLRKNIKVYLHDKVVPTPYVAYGVKKFNCCAGIMITASHNRKEDNGYKVYWDNGAQIISPIDKEITSSIKDSLQPEFDYYDKLDVMNHPKLINPMPVLEEAYLDDIFRESCYNYHFNGNSLIKVAYSAMHGVGYERVNRIMEKFGFSPVIPIKEQVDPNPDFPSVRHPNPEEPSSLELAIKFCDKEDIPIILANDPDADRLALAEKVEGKWHIFTGNEIGTMLSVWCYQNFMKRNPNFDKSKLWMISSTVSSKFLKTLADKEGFNWTDTLTGFKWMGNLIDKLYQEDPSLKVIFAYEEAIGFMPNDIVWDKDGVSTSAVARELIASLYSEGKTLFTYLDGIYSKYGYHICRNGYYISDDALKTRKMFDELRNWSKGDEFCHSVMIDGIKVLYPKYCSYFEVANIRDLSLNYDSETMDSKPKLPASKSSEFLTFKFKQGITLSLRTSGTEPKIKYYTEMISRPDEKREVIEAKLDEFIKAMVNYFYRPKIYGFS